MDRDFKGIWIPKELWLNENLTMLEKVIFVEIDSLDNEDHCTAGNEYFANFCNCSESKITKAIKKLKELGMIEELSFDGRHRKIRVVKSTNEPSKKYETASQNLRSNNIVNKQNNNTSTNSKELIDNKKFEFGKTKPKKESLYSKCEALIMSFTYDVQVKKDLHDYLQVLLEMRNDGYTLYTNVWKGLLKKLKELSEDPKEQHKIIRQSIERGYKTFFPVNNNWSQDVRKGKPWEEGLKSETYTLEELEEERKEMEKLEAQGRKVWF